MTMKARAVMMTSGIMSGTVDVDVDLNDDVDEVDADDKDGHLKEKWKDCCLASHNIFQSLNMTQRQRNC